MKILNANKFYRIVGGSERYFFDLTNLLESRGHKVIPFSMQDSRNRETPYRDYFVSHVDYRKNSIGYILRNAPKIFGKTVYSLESKHKMEALIRRDKPDIAHIHMIDHQISPSILDVLKKNEIPMVQTLHEYKLICPNYKLFIEKSNEICERCKGGKYYNAVVHKCLKNSLICRSCPSGVEVPVFSSSRDQENLSFCMTSLKSNADGSECSLSNLISGHTWRYLLYNMDFRTP